MKVSRQSVESLHLSIDARLASFWFLKHLISQVLHKLDALRGLKPAREGIRMKDGEIWSRDGCKTAHELFSLPLPQKYLLWAQASFKFNAQPQIGHVENGDSYFQRGTLSSS